MAVKMIKKYDQQVGVSGQSSNVKTNYVADGEAKAAMQLGSQLQGLGKQAEGFAIKEYDKRSAIEYQYAMNEANKKLNDFTLGLHNDDDYGSYDDKRIKVMDSIRESLGGTFKSEKARTAFDTWLNTKEENVRFATVQLAQQKEDDELTAKGMMVYNDAVESGDLEMFEQSLVALSDILTDTQVEQLRQDGIKKIEIGDVYEDQRIALENDEEWEFDEELYPNLSEKERHTLDITWQESVNRKKAIFNKAQSELQQKTFATLVDDLIERPGSLTNSRLEALTIPNADGMVALEPSVRLSLYNAAKNALKGNMTTEQKNIANLAITPDENAKLYGITKMRTQLPPWDSEYVSGVDLLDMNEAGELTYRQTAQLQRFNSRAQSEEGYSSVFGGANTIAEKHLHNTLKELESCGMDNADYAEACANYEFMTRGKDIDPNKLMEVANDAIARVINKDLSKYKLHKAFRPNAPSLAGEILMNYNAPEPEEVTEVIDKTQKIINEPENKEFQTCVEVFGE